MHHVFFKDGVLKSLVSFGYLSNLYKYTENIIGTMLHFSLPMTLSVNVTVYVNVTRIEQLLSGCCQQNNSLFFLLFF